MTGISVHAVLPAGRQVQGLAHQCKPYRTLTSTGSISGFVVMVALDMALG
jgi:hypothetical protein